MILILKIKSQLQCHGFRVSNGALWDDEVRYKPWQTWHNKVFQSKQNRYLKSSRGVIYVGIDIHKKFFQVAVVD